jgi:hypothetical protein
MKKHLQLLVIIIVASLINKERANAQVERTYSVVKSPFLNFPSMGIAKSFNTDIDSTNVRNVEISNQTNFVTNAVIDPPTNVRVDNANVCIGASVTLTATCITGQVVWYSQATGGVSVGTGSPLIDKPLSNLTYYATCVDVNSESSRVSTPLIIVKNPFNTVLFKETFEGSTIEDWFIIDVDASIAIPGIPRWHINNNIPGVAWNNSGSPAYSADDWMWTPLISGITAGTQLKWDALSGFFNDEIYVANGKISPYEVRIMKGTDGPPTGWPRVMGNQLSNSVQIFSTSGENDYWTTHEFSLANYSGQSVYIGFRSTDPVGRLLIDNVFVEEKNIIDPTLVSAAINQDCSNGNVTLSANCLNSTTVRWYNQATGGTPLGTGSPFVHSPTSTTTYYASCFNVCESKRVATPQVVVNTMPTNVIVSNTTICKGVSITLSANCAVGATLKWYAELSEISIPIGTGTGFSVTPIASTQYYAACETSNCKSTKIPTELISVNPLPAIPTNVSVDNAFVCIGYPISLKATCEANSKVVWYTQATGGTSIGIGNSFSYTPLINSIYYAACEDTSSNNACSRVATSLVTVTTLSEENRILFSETFERPESLYGWFSGYLTNPFPNGGTGGWSWGTNKVAKSTLEFFVDDWMWTPLISGINTKTKLRWKAKSSHDNLVLPGDGYEVRVMTGTNGPPYGWLDRETYQDGDFGNFLNSTQVFAINNENSYWTTREVSLATFAGQAVYIGFRNHSINNLPILEIDDVTVQDQLGSPIMVTANKNEVCSESEIILTANCNGTINWYDQATGGIALGTGSPFVYSPKQTATYYASCGGRNCETSRVSTNEVVVKSILAPVITAPLGLSVCSPTTLTLTSSGCDGLVSWSGGASGSSLSLSNVGTYSFNATCTVNGCTSKTFAGLEIKAKPNAPTITPPSNLSVCSSATLTASGCAGTVTWSQGATTGTSLTVTTAGTYAISATCTVNGCISDPSSTINLIIYPIPIPPQNVRIDNTLICQGSSVSLTAQCEHTAQVTWYTQAIGGESIGIGSPFIHIPLGNLTYYVTCKNNCESPRIATPSVSITNNGYKTFNSATEFNSLNGWYIRSVDDNRSWWHPIALLDYFSVGTTFGNYTSWFLQQRNGSYLFDFNLYGGPVGAAVSYHNDSRINFSGAQMDDWLWTPLISNITENTKLNWKALSNQNLSYEVRIMTGTNGPPTGGEQVMGNQLTNSTLIFDINAENNFWTNRELSLATFAGQSIYVGFRNKSFITASGMNYLKINDIIVDTPLVPPTVVTANVNEICGNGTVTLTANCSVGNVKWYSQATGGAILGAGSPFIFAPSTTINYYAACDNACQSSRVATNQVKVNLVSAPTITPPASLSVCSPSTLTLTANGCVGTVTWSQGSATGTSLTISSAGTYNITATCTVNGCTSEPSAAVTGLEIKAKPNAPTITPPASLSVCSPATHSLTASGCAGTVTWSQGSATGTSLTISSAGTYNITATCTVNGCTSEPSAAVTGVEIKAKPNAPTITPPASLSVCSPATHSLTASGCAGTVTWSQGAVTGTSLTLSTVGTYSITATCTVNGCTSEPSAAVTGVEIKAKPNAPTITPPASLSVCSPATHSLTASGCAGTVTWSQGSATGTSLTISSAGTYNITATCTVNGCTSEPSAAVTGVEIKAKPNAPTITPPASLSVCSPATLTLTASGCAGTVIWSQGSATGTSLTISSAGTYSITATCTVNGCTSEPSAAVTGVEIKAKPNAPTIAPPASLSVCSPLTLILTANGCAGTVTWSQGSATGTTLTISSAGTYSITATCTVNGCTSEPSAAVTGLEIKAKPNAPTITPPASLSVCSPATLTLTASGCAGTVTWSQGSATGTSLTLSTVGTYSIKANCTVNGCTSEPSAAVTGLEIKAKPNSAASNTGPYTIGQTITLNGSGSGTYSWTGPNNFNSSLNNPLITNALSTNAGVYTLVVVGTNGCQATATTNVVVGSIDPCNISRIVDYLYVKAGNPYQPLVQLSNGVIINQITEKVSILINPVCPSVSIESFEMSVQGPELNWNILQNVAPYGLFDNFGLEGRYFTPGNYTLTVTGYAQDNKGGGITYGPKIISFVVVGYLATINTPTISKTNICAGSSVDVTFATLGTFNAANQFQVELSDSSGSFLNPVVIGRTNSVGTITCLIPQNTLQGTKYLIRVISSNQVVVSNAVISKITVNPLNYSLVSPSNNLTGTGIKKAVDSINASNKIISPANVVYQAGKSVLLTPGFESNGVFKAEIKACNN